MDILRLEPSNIDMLHQRIHKMKLFIEHIFEINKIMFITIIILSETSSCSIIHFLILS